jgi:hypothetical protein
MRSLLKLMDEAVREYDGVVRVFAGDGDHGRVGRAGCVRGCTASRMSRSAVNPERLKAAGPELEAHGVATAHAN